MIFPPQRGHERPRVVPLLYVDFRKQFFGHMTNIMALLQALEQLVGLPGICIEDLMNGSCQGKNTNNKQIQITNIGTKVKIKLSRSNFRCMK
jgi:hypothetical protein